MNLMETTETTDFALNLQDERSKIYFNWGFTKEKPELKTLECDILNPDLLTFQEIKFMWRTSHI